MLTLLHTFLPDPIIFHLGPLAFRWYGLLMVVGMLAGLFVASRLAERYHIASRQHIYDLAFYLILGGLIGARVYAIFLELPFYLAYPFEIIAVWHGGLAIHGGLIGGVLGLWFFCKKQTRARFTGKQIANRKLQIVARNTQYAISNVPFASWLDVLAPALALGQAIGRWGNYFNQELFGLPTTASWGIPIAIANRPIGYSGYEYFHPTFLYESALDLVNFLVLMFLFRWVYGQAHRESHIANGTSHIANGESQLAISNVQCAARSGVVTSVYLLNYGVIRLLMEQFRIDHTPELLGVRWPIIVSAGLIVIGILGILRTLRLRVRRDV